MQENNVLLYTSMPNEKETKLIEILQRLVNNGEKVEDIAYILAYKNSLLLSRAGMNPEELNDILIKDYLFNKLSHNKNIIAIEKLDEIYENRNQAISIFNSEFPIDSKKDKEEMKYLLATNYINTLDNKFKRGYEAANDVYEFLSTIDNIKTRKKVASVPVVTIASSR